jgi:hypothetical protein
MNVQNLIEGFARKVASSKQGEKEDIKQHIQQFYDKLAPLPEVDYITIHIRHPLLTNSRESLAIPTPKAVSRTQTVLKTLLANGHEINTDLAFAFHAKLLDIYFKLIGRSDSFSDSVLRAAGSSKSTSPRQTIAAFAFVGPGEPSISYEDSMSVLRINVDREVRYRLLGWDGYKRGQTVEETDCKLLPLFYRVIYGEICGGLSNEEAIVENARDTLEGQCFFTSREAFISSEAAKLVRDEISRTAAKRAFQNLFKGHVFDGHPHSSHGEQVSRAAQILAMVQSVGIYSPVSSDEFAIYAYKPEDPNNPFAHGITLGGRNLVDKFLINYQRDATSLIQNINEKLRDRYKGDNKDRKKPIQEEVSLKEKDRKALQLAGLHVDAYDCLMYAADHLLGKRHENDPLSFRLAVGTNETLRQFFEPVTRETRILSQNEAAYSDLDLVEKRNLQPIWNGLDRILAIIEGNYSFAQHESLYLCFAYTTQGWHLRYLGRFHSRIKRQIDSGGRRPASRIEQIERISLISRGILFAFLETNDTGYVAFNGGLLGTGNKRSNPRWKQGPQKGTLVRRLSALLSPQFKNEDVTKKFLPRLYNVVQQIADTPGKGATFVVGRWRGHKNLESRCQKMTAVFEMIEGWRLLEVDEVILYQAAIQDGAIVIGTDTNKLYCRRQLVAVDDKGMPFDPERWPSKNPIAKQWSDPASQYRWPESGSWYKWGTRHRSAASLGYVGRGKFIVVCVSSDTAVHLFNGKEVHVLRD